MRRADLILGLVVTVVGGYALEAAIRLPLFAKSGTPGPGLFPLLISILLTGLGVILAVTSAIRWFVAPNPGSAETPVEGAEHLGDAGRRFLRSSSVWVLFSLAVPLVGVLGFVPAALVFLYVLLSTMEKRRGWKAVAVAVAVPIAVSFVFTVLLKVQLPRGVLSHLPLGI